ncbi:MAG: ABC transporter permease [Anaerolineales bacterium]|nr:ABC transporter permease [Anaerolineales bacterium]MBS3752601.1 ABC transporter permease [Anaerolineales bacterium]
MPQKEENKTAFIGFWQGLLDDWMAVLTRPNIETYIRLKERATSPKIVLNLALLGLVIGLYVLTIQPPAFIQTDSLLLDLGRLIFYTEADFFILSLILFVIAGLLGGTGGFVEHSYLLSLITAPLGLVIVAFLFVANKLGLTLAAIMNPLSSIGITTIFIVLFGLYAFLLLLFALEAAHEMESHQVIYTIGAVLGSWGILRVIAMFAAGEDNIITQESAFLAEEWARGTLQQAILGHLWMVAFSVFIAVVIGVVMGVLITMPPKRPSVSHLFFLIPLGVFFLIWAAPKGWLGMGIADPIMEISDTLDIGLTRAAKGFFGPLLSLLSAIVRKPAAVGMIGVILTVILYALLLAGESASELTLYIAGIILTIPSIALFGVFIGPFSIGAFNAVVALTLYAQLPILRNTYTGIKEVKPEIVEAGRGMGMTEFQLLRNVKIPIATPVIMAGVRVSVVMLVGIAAIASYIGNDTLGDYIFHGIQRVQPLRYYAGAITVAVFALSMDYFLGWLQNRLTPEGLKGRR